MELKTLGSTRTTIPAIGFGTWRYTGGVGPLRAAMDQGACLIDTAEIYGTEEVVGQAIQGRREQVFLATKVAPRNFRRRDLIAAADRSLSLLGTDHIDLYQLHWPNYAVPLQETMAAMEQLVDSGKVRFIGVSNFSVRYLKMAQAALSKYRIVSNQVRYSLIDRTVERNLLSYCEKNEITVIAFSPLGKSFPEMQAADSAGVLRSVCRETGKTEAQVALNWLVAKQNVVAIPKASTPAHAIEDYNASGWRLPPDKYRLLETKIPCHRRGSLVSTLAFCKRYVAQRLGRQI
jgi:diketogulonate reductase-like aldo/keto reductase